MVYPNILAYLMLLAWPFIAWQMYRRMDPARALIWNILGGYLILPPAAAAINFPVVPDLNKDSIPNLLSLALSVFLLKDRVPIMPDSTIGKVLIVIFIISPFATVLTNGDEIYIAAGNIQGMRIYDSVAAVTNQLIYLLPFFLARRYLASEESMRALLAALVVSALFYSVPMLIEVRLSPQMNVWVYGFFQHDFFQTIRFGGYRPVVFLPHGLWVAFYTLMALLAAAIAFRIGPSERRPWQLFTVVYLAGLLVLCRSFGALAFAAFAVPLILLVSQRTKILIAALIALVVLVYPLLRGLQVVPVDTVVELTFALSPERAESFQFRIDNEEDLLARAAERPLFGWGGYGRNLLHDPITGRVLSIADGAWVIQIGIYGWLGYIAEFGLLALPLLALGRRALRPRGLVFSPYAGGLALIFGLNLADLVPNGTLIAFTWLMAGSLLGYAEGLARAAAGPEMAGDGAVQPKGRRTVI